MNYKERLNAWAIARLLPNMQRTIVQRFRSQSDAIGYLKFLQQHIPEGKFVVVFDCQSNLEESADLAATPVS